MSTTDYKLIKSVDGIREYLTNSKIIAFDYETAPLDDFRHEPKAALNPHKSKIVGCSFSKKVNTGIYVPVCHRDYENIDNIKFFTFLKEILENESIIKIAHNLPFESMFSYHYGIVIQKPVYDHICASQLSLKDDTLDFRNLHESGLKTLARDIFNEELPTFEDVTDGRYFDELNPDALLILLGSIPEWNLGLHIKSNAVTIAKIAKDGIIIATIPPADNFPLLFLDLTKLYCSFSRVIGGLVELEI